ncbi:hypothetical protein HK096_008721, partial [Nowakowskiella sp. JEL0078]
MECEGCKQSLYKEISTNENIISFNNASYHLNCFKCDQCDMIVAADDNPVIVSETGQ